MSTQCHCLQAQCADCRERRERVARDIQRRERAALGQRSLAGRRLAAEKRWKAEPERHQVVTV